MDAAGARRRISRIDNIAQHLDRQKFCLWTPSQNFRQIKTYINLGFMVYSLCGVLVLKGSDSELFLHLWTLERAYSMEPIQGRLRTLMATVDDPDTRELLEDTVKSEWRVQKI